ncbi:MAG: ROK family protein [Pseudomonadota bacterium]
MSRAANVFSLVADIGGTNTRVALAEGPALLTETIRKFRNADYPGLETVLRAYTALEDDVDCRAASVAIAGPVRDGSGTLTNLDWTIDEATLARATKAEFVAVLNDLEAQGHALGRLAAENLREVVPGPAPRDGAPQLVIGVGTGFNVAPVHYADGRRVVAPSEAGHANLPIRTEAELRLCQYVETAHGFPAVEDVLSGRGLERLYAFLGHEAGDHRELSAADIMDQRTQGETRAVEAAKLFVRMLGTVAGNQALIHLPFGGIYLAGGVARAFAPHLAEYGFSDAFRDKGRFAGFMQNFAVSVIEDDFAALTGSAAHLARISA